MGTWRTCTVYSARIFIKIVKMKKVIFICFNGKDGRKISDASITIMPDLSWFFITNVGKYVQDERSYYCTTFVWPGRIKEAVYETRIGTMEYKTI